jgi:hypothetical protein
MLKRTITLLGLTITVGALLLTLGCGGHNSTMPSVGSSEPSLPTRGDTISEPQMGFFRTLWGTNFVLMRAVDSQGHPLKYRLVLRSSDGNTILYQFDQGKGEGTWLANPFSNQTVSEYPSGTWAWFRLSVPSGTYQFQAQAYHDGVEGPMKNPAVKVTVP